ncbi:MAG: hypothetical protein M3137_03820, partial [Actinomycetota bacterium]|nr:hypothetical protein [Actinomycetota bacterium]
HVAGRGGPRSATQETGTMDLALVGSAGTPPGGGGGLDAQVFISEHVVAVVPSGHSLARRLARR